MTTKKKVAHATLWSAFSIMLVTVLRLGSSVVSSRILEPSDFGVLAFALAMGALMDQLSYFGVDSALVQKKEVETIDLDVAWTFEFVRKNVLTILILLLTPVLKLWIDDVRIYWIVPMSCLSMFITSFRNNGVVMFRRHFQFRQIFYLDIFPVIIQVVVTIAGLLIWPNIAVMLIAAVFQALMMVLVSHVLFDHRPKFLWNWVRLKGFLSFGGCLLGNTIVRMIRNQGVTFAVAGFAGSTMLGYFNRGRVFSGSIFFQIIGLIWRVAYPLFSANHHTSKGLSSSFRALMALLLCVVPLTLVLYAAAAPDLIPWVLSSKWNESIPFIQLFCIESLLLFLLIPAEISFQAIGKPLYGTVNQAITCMLFLVLVYPLVRLFGVKGVILSAVAATILMLPLYVWRVKKSVLHFSWGAVVRWICPAIFATAAMWFSYQQVREVMIHPLSKVLLGSGCAIVIYAVVYLLLLGLFARTQAHALFELIPNRWQAGIMNMLSKRATMSK